MNSKFRYAVVAALAALLPLRAAFAGATMSATLPEQLVQQITMLEQYAQQATQVSNQLQMLYNQALNMKNLSLSAWQSALPELKQLIQLTAKASQISYASQNASYAFQQQYPNSVTANNNMLQQYPQQYEKWNQNTLSNVQSDLQSSNLQAQNFANEQQALQSLEAAAKTSQGRMQVLQAGAQISGLIVNQLQKLRQLQMSEHSAQDAYIAQKIEQKKAANKAAQQFYAMPGGGQSLERALGEQGAQAPSGISAMDLNASGCQPTAGAGCHVTLSKP